jgi:hypothetical protein
MAKRRKQPNSTVSGSRSHYEGLGYHVPAGYTLDQVNQLFSEWNLKLQNSGHIDIEAFSDCLAGLSSPFLRGSKSSKSYDPVNDPSVALSYVQTYIDFYMSSRNARTRYKSDYAACLFLLNCYMEQADYRDISRLATTGDVAQFKADHPNVLFPMYFNPLTMPKSHYWAYNKLRRILNHCWLWHITDQNGELTPRDLEVFGFLGLDCKGTEEYYNSVIVPLGLPAVKLKHKEAKY